MQKWECDLSVNVVVVVVAVVVVVVAVAAAAAAAEVVMRRRGDEGCTNLSALSPRVRNCLRCLLIFSA
jgi:hypothetical protein